MSNISILLDCAPQPTQIEQAVKFLRTRPEWEKELTARSGDSLQQVVNHPDIHIVGSEEETAGIEEIRRMMQEMAMTPFQASQSIFVVVGIEKASVPAQNALLKSLEEPAAHVQIILTSTQPGRVLPTILSRCVVVKSGEREKPGQSTTETEVAELFAKLESASFTEIFALSEKYKEREQALQLVDELTIFLHQKNQIQPEKKYVAQLQKLLITRDLLEKNTNVRLALEELFFVF